MSRITLKQLEQCCKHLNRLTGSPLKSGQVAKLPGKEFPQYKSNPGHFCLSQAYGGVQLVRISSEGGAETDITSGYDSKPVLYGKIQGVITGVRLAQEQVK